MHDPDRVLSALLFPPPLQSNIDALRQQFSGIEMQQGVNPQLLQAYQDFSHAYSAQTLMENAQIVRDHLGTGLAYQTTVMELNTLEHFHGASELMQRYVMVCPEVHALYRTNRVEGYYESYVDPHPEQELWLNQDYQRAVEGIVIDREEESVVQYFHREDEDRVQDLNFEQQRAIQNTWISMVNLLNGKIDPTSVTGETL